MPVAAVPAAAAPTECVVTGSSALPVVFVMFPGLVTASLIIACSRPMPARLYTVSPAGVTLAAGLILVDRSSSPTSAVFLGITIGSTSVSCPVFTNIVFCGCTSAGTSVVAAAVTASVSISIRLPIIPCASTSSISVASVCLVIEPYVAAGATLLMIASITTSRYSVAATNCAVLPVISPAL